MTGFLIRHEIAQLVHSETAIEHGLHNAPDEQQMRRLQNVCEMLDAISAHIEAPLVILCGFMARDVYAAHRGLKSPDHAKGFAADIIAPAYGTPLQLAQKLVTYVSALWIGQLVYEIDGFAQWTHVSCFAPENRSHRVMTSTREGVRLGIQAL